MARVFFYFGLMTFLMGGAGAGVAVYAWTLAFFCCMGWLLFGPGGKWL